MAKGSQSNLTEDEDQAVYNNDGPPPAYQNTTGASNSTNKKKKKVTKNKELLGDSETPTSTRASAPQDAPATPNVKRKKVPKDLNALEDSEIEVIDLTSPNTLEDSPTIPKAKKRTAPKDVDALKDSEIQVIDLTSPTPPQTAPVTFPANGKSSADIIVQIPMTKKPRIPIHSADEPTKTRFLRMVYLNLAVQGFVITLLISGCVFIPGFRDSFVDMSAWKFWLCWTIAITVLAVASSSPAFNTLMRFTPLNLVLTAINTVATGIILGSLSLYLGTANILCSVGVITVICLCIVAFSFQQKYLLTPKVTLVLNWILIPVNYVFLCIYFPLENSVWISLGPLVFVTYFATASQLVMRNFRELNFDVCLNSKEVLFGTNSILLLLVTITRDYITSAFKRCFGCTGKVPKV